MYDVRRRLAAIAITTVAATAALAGPAAAATGKPGADAAPGDPTSQAAAWLVDQLVGAVNDHFTFPSSDYADDGNTADGLLALDAAGVAHEAAARMLAWLQADAANYVGTAPNYYPGSLAKLLIVAEAENVDAHDFGGVDLIGALLGLENTGSDPATKGLYQDPDSQYGYESTITQALSLLALSNTGDPGDAPSADAVQWLLDQQCPDGGFRNNEPPHTPADCTSDVETTAFAVQGLVEVGADVSAALAWLDGRQNADGGFGSPTSNANATALAAQAFLAANDEPTPALLWLRDHQVGCNLEVVEPDAQVDADKSAVGAITFDDSGYEHDSALRATTQALQAMALQSLAMIDAAGATDEVPPTLYCYAVAGGAGGGEPDTGPKHTDRNSDDCDAGGGTSAPLRQDPETADADPETAGAIAGFSARPGGAVADPCVQPTLAETGPFPVAPAAGIAVDLMFVGGLLTVAARRRRVA
jgi:hypothetical protein